MNLALDIGNTRIKYGVFDRNTSIAFGVLHESDSVGSINEIFLHYPKIDHAIWCQSGSDRETLFEVLNNKSEVLVMNHELKLPFENLYHTPETLGLDRMALASAAKFHTLGKAALVIDCGTCLTYDYLDAHGRYHGGAISPGLAARYKAMHDYTERLPDLSPIVPDSIYGQSTMSSMHHGAFYGLVHEIDGFINHFAQSNPDLTTFLTGGDLEILRDHIKNDIFAHPNFLLEGLNQILLINKD